MEFSIFHPYMIPRVYLIKQGGKKIQSNLNFLQSNLNAPPTRACPPLSVGGASKQFISIPSSVRHWKDV